jgi:cell division protein FtsL
MYMQMLSLTAAVLALASAFFLYGINYETRQLEARVNAQERVAEQARSDIAILKAERAHLGRPERIEPFARGQGLRPLREDQMARDRNMDSLTTSSTPR